MYEYHHKWIPESFCWIIAVSRFNFRQLHWTCPHKATLWCLSLIWSRGITHIKYAMRSCMFSKRMWAYEWAVPVTATVVSGRESSPDSDTPVSLTSYPMPVMRPHMSRWLWLPGTLNSWGSSSQPESVTTMSKRLKPPLEGASPSCCCFTSQDTRKPYGVMLEIVRFSTLGKGARREWVCILDEMLLEYFARRMCAMVAKAILTDTERSTSRI